MGRKALHQGLQDPSEVERASGLVVRASIPHSDRQATLEKERKAHKGTRLKVLAESDPTDMAAESVRSLRTSLQFALMDAPNKVIAIGGPRPGVGKSFVTVNLARVFADAGKRVLLLDADLRKGSLHGYLGIHRTPGLAEAIAGEVSVADVLHKTDLAGIDFIPRGSSPTNPSELLGSERFRHMVEDLAARYDLVLIDLPPILAVTDAALVARGRREPARAPGRVAPHPRAAAGGEGLRGERRAPLRHRLQRRPPQEGRGGQLLLRVPVPVPLPVRVQAEEGRGEVAPAGAAFRAASSPARAAR